MAGIATAFLTVFAGSLKDINLPKCIGQKDGVVHYEPVVQGTRAESDVGKKKWLQKYSHRLLRLWLQRQAPLGVTPVYIGQIEEDLAKFYDEPLKRMFIETTYG